MTGSEVNCAASFMTLTVTTPFPPLPPEIFKELTLVKVVPNNGWLFVTE